MSLFKAKPKPTAQDFDAMARSCVRHVVEANDAFFHEYREERLRSMHEEYRKSAEALDIIVGILVKNGVTPDVAARLGLRYWSTGWDKRMESVLMERWKLSSVELGSYRKQLEARLEIWSSQWAKNPLAT